VPLSDTCVRGSLGWVPGNGPRRDHPQSGEALGCWLREQGLCGDDAVSTIASLRSDTAKAWRESPETDEQRAFIEAW